MCRYCIPEVVKPLKKVMCGLRAWEGVCVCGVGVGGGVKSYNIIF